MNYFYPEMIPEPDYSDSGDEAGSEDEDNKQQRFAPDSRPALERLRDLTEVYVNNVSTKKNQPNKSKDKQAESAAKQALKMSARGSLQARKAPKSPPIQTLVTKKQSKSPTIVSKTAKAFGTLVFQTSPTPAVAKSSKSPERTAKRSKSPENTAKKSKSPERKAKRSKSPENVAKRSKSPEGVAKRSKSPEEKAKRPKSPEGKAKRSKSPDNTAKKSKSPERKAKEKSVAQKTKSPTKPSPTADAKPSTTKPAEVKGSKATKTKPTPASVAKTKGRKASPQRAAAKVGEEKKAAGDAKAKASDPELSDITSSPGSSKSSAEHSSDEDHLIKPRKPYVPSTEKQKLHKELKFSQKYGKRVPSKTELQLALERYTENKVRREMDAEEKSSLEKILEYQAKKIEMQAEMDKCPAWLERLQRPPSTWPNPKTEEFYRVHARVVSSNILTHCFLPDEVHDDECPQRECSSLPYRLHHSDSDS